MSLNNSNNKTNHHHAKRNKKRKKTAQPLIPPTTQMKSRKRARQVTTLFHKYTREKDMAIQRGAPKAIIQEWEDKLQAMGGRTIYQQASQLSTSFHSTSKWVLGHLQRSGWLYGIPIVEVERQEKDCDIEMKKKSGKPPRRDTKLLEVGAINTELLDAAERTDNNNQKKYRLSVRAIDLHSMYPGRIEEADFNVLPLPPNLKTTNKQNEEYLVDRYDVIVCSMVLNCVTTPEERGEMLTRLYDFLRPGGQIFLTIPKLCLTQSPHIDQDSFQHLLGATGVGLKVVETKESPKVSFFICERPEGTDNKNNVETIFDRKWTTLKKIHHGKKYRNQFAVTLNKDRICKTRSC